MTFTKTILSIYKEKGKAWLQNLPNLVTEITNKHHLTDLKPVSNLSYNYVLSGFMSNESIILKMASSAEALQHEIAVLKAFSGFGTAKLIFDGADYFIQHQAFPGDSLKSYFPHKDAESIQIACDLMKRLHQAPLPANHNFPHLNSWLSTLDKDWDIPTPYLQKARLLKNSLVQHHEKAVLLHGDLHHDNILRDGDGWIAIDPKGVIGEPIHEIWSFLNNPQEMSSEMILNRIHQFSAHLRLDPKRITDWCFVQSILSWIWNLEDDLKPSSAWITKILDENTSKRAAKVQ